MTDPTPLWWTIRHRIVSLAFLVGLFQRLGESLSDSSISMSDLDAILKPESESRYSFFKDVIEYANRFLDTREAYLDNWKAKAKVLPIKSSPNCQSAQKLETKNSLVAAILAMLAENEIWQFFRILSDPEVAARGEVLSRIAVKLIVQMKEHLKPKDKASQQIGRLKMVLMIDEAKYLVGKKFFNAFRWTIDQVIERAWITANQEKHTPTREPLPFMAFFLGTNSTVADFLPPGEDSSARYFLDFMKVPPPFTALDWDITIPHDSILNYTTLNYESLAEMTWLCRFGRPYWQAQWGSSLAQPFERFRNASNLITLAENKLHHRGSRRGFLSLFASNEEFKSEKEDFILTCSAILGVLAVIHLDFTSPKRAEDLVASRLRWAVGCDRKRTYLLTTYPSEPLLAEAAFRLLFAKDEADEDPHKILDAILSVVAKEVENGDYDVGGDGELVARLLCNSLL
jgi:hypothetical protein